MRKALRRAHARRLCLALLLVGGCAASPAAGNCTVDDSYAKWREPVNTGEAKPGRTIQAAARTTTATPRAGSRSTSRSIDVMAQGAPAASDPTIAQNVRIASMIRGHDLAGLVRELPQDSVQRQAVIERSRAVTQALDWSALSILEQLLRWDPSAVTKLSPESKAASLQQVAQQWTSDERNERPADGTQSLPAAADRVRTLRLLLDAGADVAGQTGTLWLVASIRPSDEVLEAADLLLAHGASINRVRVGSPSPLASAAAQQNVNLVRLMLKREHATQESLDEAIVATPILETNPVIGVLLESGANINARGEGYGKGEQGFQPAWHAALRIEFEGGRELMRLLIRYKVDPNRTINRTNTPLLLLIQDPEFVKALLDLGADPNFVNGEGDTALLLATRVSNRSGGRVDDHLARPGERGFGPAVRAEVVGLLLQYGADPNARTPRGVTALMQTTDEDARTIELLIAKGATINDDVALSEFRGRQAPVGEISWALINGNDALAAALLARVGMPGAADCGALYYAAQTGSTRTLSALLDLKIDPGATAAFPGMTPLMQAATRGEAGSIKILLERHAAAVDEATPSRVGAPPLKGSAFFPMAGNVTALMMAAASNRREATKELIRHGARLDLRDDFGKTALTYALEANARDTADLLYQSGARP